MTTFVGDEIMQNWAEKDLEYIWFSAFEECRSLKEIVLPSTLKIIEDRAFQNCKNLKNQNKFCSGFCFY